MLPEQLAPSERPGLRFALLCVVVFLVAVLMIWPVAEIGILDDWSIARTAQLLATTGHVHYNGWEAPILGWMLYAALPFLHVFGFSFTLLRLLMVAIAAITVGLLQRTFVVAGLTERQAVFGTLASALSPVFLLTATTYMSDIPGLLAVVACLYCCLNALRSRQSAWWVLGAICSNLLLGTARQNAWLGLVLLVPVTLWLLRKQGRLTLALVAAWGVAIVCMLAIAWWHRHQRYVLTEHLLIPNSLSLARMLHLAGVYVLAFALDGALLCCPVSFVFVRTLRRQPKLLAAALVCGTLGGLAAIFTGHLAPFLLRRPLAPGAENLFLSFPSPMLGVPPAPIPLWLQWALTMASSVSLVLGVCGVASAAKSSPKTTSLPLLLLPYLLLCFALTLPRAVVQQLTVDRYLLFLAPFVILLLLRLQRTTNLPWSALVALAAMASFSILTFHNTFAMYRAEAAATQALERSHVPRTRIDGGLEYNYMTQILAQQVVYDSHRPPVSGPCVAIGLELMPAVRPDLAIAYPGAPCARAQGFSPVEYSAWTPPFRRVVYVVRAGTAVQADR